MFRWLDLLSVRRYFLIFWGMVYGFGAMGLAWPPTQPFFLLCVPYVLILGAVHVWFMERPVPMPHTVLLLLGCLAGWLVEVYGVATGAVFGAYHYGTVLGYAPAGVPLVIGVNWLVLVYAASQLSYAAQISPEIRPFMGATAVLLVDVFIEPVAVFLGFWSWDTPGEGSLFVAPMRNYIAWWLFSLVLLSLAEMASIRRSNPVLLHYAAFQLGFFLLLNVLLVF
jgi:putative membrane protein